VTRTDEQKEVMKITGGKGVNVVYDPVGGLSVDGRGLEDNVLMAGMIIPSLKCVAWNARLVVVGFAAGTIEKIPANLLLLKQVSVVGLFWGGGTSEPFAQAHQAAPLTSQRETLNTPCR